jgi:hypothetical protein
MRNEKGFNPRKREYRPWSQRVRRAPSASNAVVHAVLDVCAVYRQQAYRMQSRCFTVIGENGHPRPMFMGQWDDLLGFHHFGGMADVLITPVIKIVDVSVQVALWAECKSGKGKLSGEQEEFRDNVLAGGGYWIECRDCAEALIIWFREHGVL